MVESTGANCDEVLAKKIEVQAEEKSFQMVFAENNNRVTFMQNRKQIMIREVVAECRYNFLELTDEEVAERVYIKFGELVDLKDIGRAKKTVRQKFRRVKITTEERKNWQESKFVQTVDEEQTEFIV